MTVTLCEVGRVIDMLEHDKKWLQTKADEVARRLAERGVTLARMYFDGAQYDGIKDVSVDFERRGDTQYAVVAVGDTALILEFGSGVLLGYGHPEAAVNGMGPGPYPDGKGHWNDPNGWYLPKEVQTVVGRQKSYGNAPAGAMYGASKELKMILQQVVWEVFANG